jgi:hypothetical protein
MVDALGQGLRRGRGRVWVVFGAPVELHAIQRRAKGVRLVAASGGAVLALAEDPGGLPSQPSSQRRER